MSHRDRIRIALAAALIGLAAGADDPKPTTPPGPTIRWVAGAGGRVVAVEILGLAPGSVDPGRAGDGLVVRLASAPAGTPGMLGRASVAGDVLRFEPRFPLHPGRTYRAEFRAGGAFVVSDHAIPAINREPTRVVGVDPLADTVPENLLKFYVRFSGPMARGEAYKRVRLLDAAGRPLDLPFLELGEELWDRTGTRLTLLLDPGRIKRGLKPREDEGPILEAGKRYRIEVDAAWPDAVGRPLAAGFGRGFAAGPADDIQPDPARWEVVEPAAGTLDSVAARFPEPLDHALLESSLAVVGPDGTPVPGRAEGEPGDRAWRFTPRSPWAPGAYVLVVDDRLEDLAGNSVRRPFEVDRTGPEPPPAGPARTRRAITIR